MKSKDCLVCLVKPVSRCHGCCSWICAECFYRQAKNPDDLDIDNVVFPTEFWHWECYIKEEAYGHSNKNILPPLPDDAFRFQDKNEWCGEDLPG